jgi:hypothetical protein
MHVHAPWCCSRWIISMTSQRSYVAIVVLPSSLQEPPSAPPTTEGVFYDMWRATRKLYDASQKNSVRFVSCSICCPSATAYGNIYQALGLCRACRSSTASSTVRSQLSHHLLVNHGALYSTCIQSQCAHPVTTRPFIRGVLRITRSMTAEQHSFAFEAVATF